MELQLEFRDGYHGQTHMFNVGGVTIMATPPINEDYWVFRVKLHEDQSVIAFPKFGTMGIGFAQEEDWNTNLPYQSETEKICDHIWVNHKHPEITKETTLKAIKMLQDASKYYMEHEKPTEQTFGTKEDAVAYMERLFEFINKR